MVDIQPRDRRRFKRLLEESKNFESLPIRTKLSDEEVARFAAQRYRFPAWTCGAPVPQLPLGEVASHLLGYIGRINTTEKKAMEDWDDDPGQLQRHRGTSASWPRAGLRARAARHHRLRRGRDQRRGRAVRRLAATRHAGNTLAVGGHPAAGSLVEQLFGDQRGALVAIDPRSGEVPSPFVSKPTFDPNLFVDGIDADSWRELNESIDKPLLNRRAARHLSRRARPSSPSWRWPR